METTEHPFFNVRNFLLLIVCGVVLALAGGVLAYDGLKTPTAAELQRFEFACPVPVHEDTVHVRGTDVTSYDFKIPDTPLYGPATAVMVVAAGPKVAFPVKTPGRESVVAALASSPAGTTCIALVGQSTELTLYGLQVRDAGGERTVLRFEDAYAANRDVTVPIGLCLGGLALAGLMIVFRRRFLS
jgi:hypothetical protein